MKVLLTGSGGYIGTILSEALLDAGHDVVGLDTGFYNAGWLYEGVKTLPKVLAKDIRDVELSDLVGFEAVIHLAELSNDPLGQNDPALTHSINHEGTVRLIKLIKQAGISRFIYASSCSVYGASDQFVDETSPTHPLTAYAKSKVLNEQYLLSTADDSFSPLIFRNSTVYGASPRMRFDLVVNNLAALAFTTGKIKMDSDGTPWRPLVHVRDVAKAFMTALATPTELTHKQIVNVGSANGNYQIADLAQIIARVFPGSEVSLNPQGADKRNYKVRFEKIGLVLPGFTCDWDVEKGAQELKVIFEKIKLTSADFESGKYTRLKAIAELQKSGSLDASLHWQKK